ncbi:unnamed protein product [Sphagnum troendelagicum]|uniref:Uncharacterized protein n=1 Tax=Sphagnum troendelagicum TaxID=128251 RepID=A0ABP0TH84_9BRYO
MPNQAGKLDPRFSKLVLKVAINTKVILQSRHLGVQMRKRLDPHDSLTRDETGQKQQRLCSSMGSLPCPLGVKFQQRNLPGRIFSSCQSGV